MGSHSSYWIYLLIALLVPMLAQAYLSSTFNQYLRVRASSGLTGADVARRILDRNGLTDVHLTEVGGRLSDHYDPTHKTVRLSHDIYYGTSLAALAVAAHECGHAIQHANAYAPLQFRSEIFSHCIRIYFRWISISIIRDYPRWDYRLISVGYVAR